MRWPEGVRVDQALESGQVVSTAYDPMLGKVIAHGPDREAARQALVAALDDTAILGLTTNAGFLRTLVASDEFRDATIDTAWLDRHDVAAARPGARARAARPGRSSSATASDDGPFASDGFRLGADPAPVVVELDEPVTLARPARPGARPVAVVRHDRVEVVHHGQRFVFDAARRDGRPRGRGRRRRAHRADAGHRPRRPGRRGRGGRGGPGARACSRR